MAPAGAFKLLIAGAVAVVAGATALYTALWGPRARARRRLARGTSTIADHTVVTLTGKVRAKKTIEAPLSGTECVAWVAHGTEGSGEGMGRTYVELAASEVVAFELATDDGVVVVEGPDAQILLDLRPLIPRKLARETTFLDAHGRDRASIREWTFHEVAIVEGDKIQVQGLALVEETPPSDGHGYRETARRVRLVAHEGHPLTIGPAR